MGDLVVLFLVYKFMGRRIIKFFSFLLILTSLVSCKNKESFVIKGKIRCLPMPRAYLTYISPLTGIKDTIAQSEISGGEFIFRGRVDNPSMCQIEIGKRSIYLMVENTDIEVHGTLMIPDQIQITGSSSNDDWTRILRFERRYEAKRRKNWMKIVNTDVFDEIEKLETEYYQTFDSLYYVLKSEVANRPTSFGCTYYVYYAYVNQLFSLNKIVQCLNMLDEESVGDSEYYKYLKDEMMLYSGLEVNKPAPQFSVVTMEGDTLTLDHYYNKNLFLFFTSSWCDSCESYARELDEVHHRFKSPGFEVLEISLDKTQEELNDLAEKSCGWPIACDFMYWESQITKRYGVHKIPYGVLIDGKQRISSVNPSIQALSYKLRILQNE